MMYDTLLCVEFQSRTIKNSPKLPQWHRCWILSFPRQILFFSNDPTSFRTYWSGQTVRIFNGREVRIENSVTRVTVRHASWCRTVIPSDGVFNSHQTAIMDSILNCQNDVLASYTGVVLHPLCKTTFPSPGRVHGNSGRVCEKVGSKLFGIHLHLSDAVLYGKIHCSIFRMFTAKFFFRMSEFLGFRRYFSNFYLTNISSLN